MSDWSVLIVGLLIVVGVGTAIGTSVYFVCVAVIHVATLFRNWWHRGVTS
jgi:hypothetical protein